MRETTIVYICSHCGLQGKRDMWLDYHGFGLLCPRCHGLDVREVS